MIKYIQYLNKFMYILLLNNKQLILFILFFGLENESIYRMI
jgi:hypothetical protein